MQIKPPVLIMVSENEAVFESLIHVIIDVILSPIC